jgi:hypothetical protein
MLASRLEKRVSLLGPPVAVPSRVGTLSYRGPLAGFPLGLH